MPKNNRKFHKYTFFLAIFFISGILVASGLSVILVTPASSKPDSNLCSPEFEVHFISLNKSQIEGSAKSLAPDYQKIGAGGFIWKVDDYYHVLSSGFENKSDAILVQNNLKATSNLESEIVSIKFNKFSVNATFDGESKKVMTKALNSFKDCYTSLYDIAISLDTLVYNEISARLAINSVYSSVSTAKADFDTLFSSNQHKGLKTISEFLTKEKNILEKLCSGVKLNSSQTYPSLIKYRYIELLKNYQNLTEAIKNATE